MPFPYKIFEVFKLKAQWFIVLLLLLFVLKLMHINVSNAAAKQEETEQR